jgi:TolB-like protein
MRRRRLRLRLPLLLTVALAASLSPVPAAAAQEGPKVVAVLRFDNDTGDAKYDNLGRGLAAMMISDLSVLEQIRLVERERLEELQTELEFQQSAWADPATAQTAGLMMGAEYVVTGSFMTVDPNMLLGTRIVDVETTEIRKAAEVTGRSDQLFELQQRLAEEFIDGLELTLTEEDRGRLRERQESNRVEDIETVLSFSRALCYVDAGAYDYALEEMLKVRDAAPGSVLFGVTLRLLRDRAASEARGRAEDQARGALGRLLGRNRPVPRRTLRPPGC